MLLKFLKIFKYLLITIFIFVFLGIAAVFILYSVKKESFKQMIIENINQKINAKLVTSSVDFTIFHDFPNVTIKLADVKLIPTSNPTDTIVQLGEAAISFDIVQLWYQKLKISSVTLSTGKILYSDVTKAYLEKFTNDTTSKSMYIKINYIGLNHVILTYNLNKVYLNANIEQYKLRIKVKETILHFDNKLKINQLYYRNNAENFTLRQKIVSDFQIITQPEKWELKELNVLYGKQKLYINGLYNTKTRNYQASIQTENLKIQDVKEYLPKNKDLVINNAVADISLNLKGNIDDRNVLIVKGESSIKEGKAVYRKIDLSEINTELSFELMPFAKRYDITVKDFTCKTKESKLQCNGTVSLTNRLALHFKGNATILFQEFHEILNSTDINSITGTATSSFNISYAGKDSTFEIKNLDVTLDSKLENIKLAYQNRQIEFSGDVVLKEDKATLQHCFVKLDNCTMKLDGMLDNVYKSNNNRNFKGNLVIDTLDMNNSPFPDDTTSNSLELTINLKCKLLKYNQFRFQNLTTRYESSAKRFFCNALRFDIWDGKIDNASYSFNENTNGAYFNGNFQNLSLKALLSDFGNFGMSYIHANNTKGSISGKADFSCKFDKNDSIINSTISSDVDIRFINTSISDFKPLMDVFSFLKIPRPANNEVVFQPFQCQLNIANNLFTIHPVLIKNNIVDFKVEGTHYLDNKFIYHLQFSLSELIKKNIKLKENKDLPIAEDENNDRKMMVYVLLSGNDSIFNIKYDNQKAFQSFKEKLTEEKNAIKQIFQGKEINNKPAGEKKHKIGIEGNPVSEEDKKVVKTKPLVKKDSKPKVEWKDE
jgi:hypothetical protein